MFIPGRMIIAHTEPRAMSLSRLDLMTAIIFFIICNKNNQSYYFVFTTHLFQSLGKSSAEEENWNRVQRREFYFLIKPGLKNSPVPYSVTFALPLCCWCAIMCIWGRCYREGTLVRWYDNHVDSWPCNASLARSSSCSLSPSCTRSSVAESRLAEQPPWVSSRSLLNMSFICLSRWTSSWSWATSSRHNTEGESKRDILRNLVCRSGMRTEYRVKREKMHKMKPEMKKTVLNIWTWGERVELCCIK